MSDIPFSIRPNGISSNEISETYATITELNTKDDILTFTNNLFTPFFTGKIQREGDTITYFSPDFSPYLTIAAAASTYEPIQLAKVNLSAYKTANTTITTYNLKTDITGYTVDTESNAGSLNTGTGIFTAPRSGLYKIETQITFKDYEGDRLFTMDNFIDYKAAAGSWTIYKVAVYSSSDRLLDAYTIQNSSIIYLNINDQIKVAGAARAGGTLAWTILALVGSWNRVTSLNIYSID